MADTLPGVRSPLIDQREPFFDGDQEKDTDKQPAAVQCQLADCVDCRERLAAASKEVRAWRVLAVLLASILALVPVGCAAFSGPSARAELARCGLERAPEALDAVRGALAEVEWRAALGGLGLRLGGDALTCAVRSIAAGYSAPVSGVRASSFALTGCPSGSCDVQGPEAGVSDQVVRERAARWLSER